MAQEQGGSAPGTLSKSAYAAHRGVTPAMVTHWYKAGRIALTPDGKAVDVARSDAMLAATLDPSRGGKGGVPTRDRGDPSGSPATGGHGRAVDSPAGPPAAPPSASASFAVARAVRERISAQAAQLDLERKRGSLIERAAMERAVADAMGPVLQRLDGLSAVLAPKLVGMDDVRALQNRIDVEIDALRQEFADTFRTMAGGGPGRQ